ncbi:MAG: branched-chain amino acid ABC-type transport system, permease component [Actinomycetia bacterium]|nr:branched-chain amino acid ABC-type transport system, permease component [Actinomycetes bacterium]
MSTFLTFLITGLTTAAIYAVGASGLVLTYTTTGVFNFAHGAVGMFGAFLYWQLRFDWGWPAPIALAIVLLVMAPLFGVFLEVAIMRNLEGTSEAVRLVVSISLLAALVGAANWIWDPTQNRFTASFFEGKGFDFFGTRVTWHEAATVLIAIAVAIGLRFVLYNLRAGVAMRATVDDRPLAALNGARSDRSAMLAWAIGCSLAALSGILFLGTLALDAGTLSLLIVNAYAAAMIGRLRSLPMTFLGALIIGLAEAFWQIYRNDLSQHFHVFTSTYLDTFASAIAVIILFVVLWLLPNPRLRGHSRVREFFPTPSLRGSLVFVGIVIAGAAFISAWTTQSHQIDLANVFALGIIALSLVPLTGFAGQVSLASLSFAGIGAVTMAHLGGGGDPLGLLWAALICAGIGALVAIPALRLSGIYLALATAAFAVMLDRWIFNLPNFRVFGWFNVKLFEQGSVAVTRLKVFGLDTSSPRAQVVLGAVAFSLIALFVVALRRSRFGRRLLAMKDSEAACATLGMNLVGTKVAVFALSAAIAGVGGALYGGVQQSVNAQMFSFINGLPIFMLAVVGGIGAIGGAFFAGISLALLTTILPDVVPSLSHLLLITPGLIGISLGRNPSGAVSQIREGFAPMRQSKVALGFLAASLTAIVVLRSTNTIANWPTFFAALVVLVASVPIGEMFAHKAPAEVAEEPGAGAGAEIPLEWVGITRPFTDEDVRQMDAALGISEVEMYGAARS